MLEEEAIKNWTTAVDTSLSPEYKDKEESHSNFYFKTISAKPLSHAHAQLCDNNLFMRKCWL